MYWELELCALVAEWCIRKGLNELKWVFFIISICFAPKDRINRIKVAIG